MPFDLRLPLGLIFGIYGFILVGVGVFGGPDLSRVSLNINMNFWWGFVLLIFAAFMLASWKMGRKK